LALQGAPKGISEANPHVLTPKLTITRNTISITRGCLKRENSLTAKGAERKESRQWRDLAKEPG